MKQNAYFIKLIPYYNWKLYTFSDDGVISLALFAHYLSILDFGGHKIIIRKYNDGVGGGIEILRVIYIV